MIRTTLVLAGALVAATAAFAETKPAKLSVHTWVREDLFSGFMANDMTRFEQGLAKLEEILKENPNDPGAIAWKGGAEVYLATRALEAGKKDEFDRLYASGVAKMDQAVSMRDPGAIAVSAASNVYFADRMPQAERKASLERGSKYFQFLYQGQKAALDQLPLHIKGELLAGLAQSAAKLEKQQEAEAWLKMIVEKMPGTVYESRAKRWLEQPQMAAKGTMVCMTCHDEGRLKPRLAALEKAGQ